MSNGTIETCHTATYYYLGKDPTFALFCAAPFGLNGRQKNAWFADGDGLKLMNEFYQEVQRHRPCRPATPAAQMGGWFRKEINSVSDLNGLKIRMGGFAGRVLQKLGTVPQIIAGGDIYPALEKGAIDAAEWVGPYDDEKLGFYKVAKFYYYPGWWEGGTALHFMINTAAWEKLPKSYQAIATVAAEYANVESRPDTTRANPAALKRLIAAGTQLRPFPQPVMEACWKAANEVYAETSAANAEFKKLYENMTAFRKDEYLWWQVAEYGYDSFMIRALRS